MNECAYENGGCQHKCINSGGSYRCECNSGYYLQADNRSCAGRVKYSFLIGKHICHDTQWLGDNSPRACARGKAISFVCLSVHRRGRAKTARSRVVGICSCYNYHELVDIGEKLVSVCFELLNMAH